MDFKENINRICTERGTNLTAVVKEVKGSSSFATAINKGSLPKESEMLEMAKILQCSVMDFFADEEDLAPQIKNPPRNEDEEDIIRVYRSLSRRNQHEFMAMVYEYESKSSENTVSIYRAAKSSDFAEHQIIEDTNNTIEKLKHLSSVTDEKDL